MKIYTLNEFLNTTFYPSDHGMSRDQHVKWNIDIQRRGCDVIVGKISCRRVGAMKEWE